VDDNIEYDHLHSLDQSLLASQLLSQRESREVFHRRKPLAILVDKQIPLKASQVGKAKPSEDGSSSQIDVSQRFLFGKRLHHYVGCRRLDGRHGKLSKKGAAY
jgi:hypothetical protein